ncbi:MAG: O-antigen ligase family protein [Patescibacteria group bacterium]
MNKTVKSIIKAIIWALPAVALVVPSDMFFPFITGKGFLFRVAVELAFCMYVGLAVVDASYRPKWNALSIAFAVFAGVMLIADIFAMNPSKAFWSNFERMDGYVTLAHMFLYFILLSSFLKTKKDWRNAMLAGISISIYMLFFCFLQIVGEATINQGGVRVDGSLGNAAYLGAYMLFQFFFLLYIWLSEEVEFKGIGSALIVGSFGYALYYLARIGQAGVSHTTPGVIIFIVSLLIGVAALWVRLSDRLLSKYGKRVANIAYGITAAGYLVVLYFTATRGAILGLIGGIIVGAAFLIYKERHNKLIFRASLGVLAGIIILMAGFYFIKDTSFVKNSPVLSRFASLSLDTQGQARNYIWPMALEGAKEHPILGWGQEGFNYVFEKYYVPEMITQEPFFDRAHNSFLDWLVAGGVLGFLAYLSLYILSLWFIWRSAVFGNKEKAVLIALLAGYAFQNLFIFDNLTSYIFFAIFLALVSARSNAESATVGKPEDFNFSLLSTCAIGFVVIALMINARGYLQNTTLIKGLSQQADISTNLTYLKKSIGYNSFGTSEAREQLIRIAFQAIASSKVSDDIKMQFANATVDEMDKQIKSTPYDVRIYLEFGDFLSQIGAYDHAISILEEGLALSPKKQQVSFAIAQAYLGKAQTSKDPKDTDTAIKIAKSAYDLSPDHDAVRLPYISTLLIAGKISDAVNIIKNVDDASPLVNEQVVKIMLGSGYSTEAEAMLHKAIATNSQNSDAYVLLSDVYVSVKDGPNALKALEDLEAAIPSQKDEAEKDIAALKQHFR